MSESMKLEEMIKYARDRLSTGENFHADMVLNGRATPTQNGLPTPPVSPTSPPANPSTGFIANRQYGDWDTTSPPTKIENSMTGPQIYPRQPMSSRTSISKPTQKFIPEHEIEIPENGSLREFSADDMSTFLRYMGVEERIVTHVHKKGLDGVKFSKLKDSDLEALSMKNPIICHFRDKSTGKDKGGKKKAPFML